VARLQHPRRWMRREDETRLVRDRGVRGSVVSTPWEENAHALRKPARPERVASEVGPPKRSSDVVKRPVPRSRRKEPYSPCGSALRKWREEIGNTRGAGARSSIGWQTSVESIARRERREIARSVGEQDASQEEVRNTA